MYHGGNYSIPRLLLLGLLRRRRRRSRLKKRKNIPLRSGLRKYSAILHDLFIIIVVSVIIVVIIHLNCQGIPHLLLDPLAPLPYHGP